MSALRRPRVLWAVGIAAVYFARWIVGATSGVAYSVAMSAASNGDSATALRFLEHAVTGFDTFDALLQRADLRTTLDEKAKGSDPKANVVGELRAASRDYVRAAAVCPASGLPWAGLGQVYTRAERVAFESRGAEPTPDSPWADVGRSGRIAVGMFRLASRRNPEVYSFSDQLVFLFLELGLRDEAIASIREAARTQPNFFAHAWNLGTFPKDLLQAFQEESRSSLGKAPMLGRGRHLLSLGRLEDQLGDHARAIEDLGEAMKLPADTMSHSEVAFYLAVAQIDAGRYDDAERSLDVASRYPTLLVASLQSRAEIALKRGHPEQALRWLRDARRIEPSNLWLCLEYARNARAIRDWPGAIEALQWGSLRHPDDPAPRVALVEVYVDSGDQAAADRALEDLAEIVGENGDVLRLRRLVAKPLAPAAP